MINTIKIFFLLAGMMVISLSAVAASAFDGTSFSRQQSQADDGFDELDREFAPPAPNKPPPPKVIIKEKIIVKEKLVPVPKQTPRQTPRPIEKPPVRQSSTPERTVVSNGFRFSLQSCTLASRKIQCDLTVLSLKDDKDLTLYSNNGGNSASSLFDNIGNQYAPYLSSVGNMQIRYYKTKRLIKGIKTRIQVFFNNISSETSSITMLELRLDGFDVQFREISFSS